MAQKSTRVSGKASKKKLTRRPEAHDVPGAVESALPEALAPQLATLVSSLPTRGDWLYEIKFDGYRLLARFEDAKPKLFTRRGHDWSAKFPNLVAQLQTIGVRSGWLDGEIVVMNEDGLPDFNALQNSLDRNHSSDVVYFLFDVLFLEGYDLRKARLRDRRQLLAALLKEWSTDYVRLSDTFEADPASILSSACRMGLEGIIAKRADSPYTSRRTDTWLKIKCKRRQEFVICGYHDRAGAWRQVGSLILGVYDNGELVPVGSVGTGWDSEEAIALKAKLARLERDAPPFAGGPKKPGRWSKRKPGGERWVEPSLVAEVEFTEWTSEGQVRHASFVSLRADTEASSVIRETESASRAR